MRTSEAPSMDAESSSIIDRIKIIYAEADPDAYDELSDLAFTLCIKHRQAWNMASRCEVGIHDTVKELEAVDKIVKDTSRRLYQALSEVHL